MDNIVALWKKRLTTEAEVQRFIEAGAQENQYLDFKAKDALEKENSREFCKDVSAFANADGGLIIYGVAEHTDAEGAKTYTLDDGVERTRANSRDSLYQKLNSGIQPIIYGVDIVFMPKADNPDRYLVLVFVPKSGNAPHQNAHDKRYHVRMDTGSNPMPHWQLMDVLSRRHFANPEVAFYLHGPGGNTPSDTMRIRLRNNSSTPVEAFYIKFWVPRDLLSLKPKGGGLKSIPLAEGSECTLNVYEALQPLFQQNGIDDNSVLKFWNTNLIFDKKAYYYESSVPLFGSDYFELNESSLVLNFSDELKPSNSNRIIYRQEIQQKVFSLSRYNGFNYFIFWELEGTHIMARRGTIFLSYRRDEFDSTQCFWSLKDLGELLPDSELFQQLSGIVAS